MSSGVRVVRAVGKLARRAVGGRDRLQTSTTTNLLVCNLRWPQPHSALLAAGP